MEVALLDLSRIRCAYHRRSCSCHGALGSLAFACKSKSGNVVNHLPYHLVVVEKCHIFQSFWVIDGGIVNHHGWILPGCQIVLHQVVHNHLFILLVVSIQYLPFRIHFTMVYQVHFVFVELAHNIFVLISMLLLIIFPISFLQMKIRIRLFHLFLSKHRIPEL